MRFLAVFLLASLAIAQDSCPPESISFELVTGYVYTAPADMLDSQPGTLMLTDCIDTCRQNSSCNSINYETGLCVLFSSHADDNDGQLTPSQFPVFTIYVQKNCITDASTCDAAWTYERVMGHELTSEVKKRGHAEDRQECMGLCLGEKDFECRAALFDTENGDCRLLDQDRHTLAGLPVFAPSEGTDYLETNCAGSAQPKKLCLFEETKGNILKTVDSVYQAIATRADCEDLCVNAPFRCHSYDFNDTGDNVCRLSHHSAYTLTQIEEPFLAIEEATTYSLSACYNVSIDCQSSSMTANFATTTLFEGKVYAKGSPVNCMVDIDSSLEFSISMGYNDLECGVERVEPGVYNNEVIIQHHDRIITSADLGLSLTCQYDLANKSVSNTVDLAITGEISPSLYEEAVVDSPNVIMRVETDSGVDTKTAVVGDPLNMVFEILDADSPYEIFVRDLVALDGATDTELLLIDSRGCPADPSIMSELRHSEETRKTLVSDFDAFRFPTSRVVQFRAMVTPCMPKCEPVVCDIRDYTGQSRNVESYGRKKRGLEGEISALMAASRQRRMTRQQPEEMLVVSTIQIVDKMGKRNRQNIPRRFSEGANLDFGFDNHLYTDSQSVNLTHLPVVHATDMYEPIHDRCVDDTSLIAGAIVFIVVQVFLLLLLTLLWRKKRSAQAKEVVMMTPDAMSTTDSLSYIYETGIPRRMQ